MPRSPKKPPKSPAEANPKPTGTPVPAAKAKPAPAAKKLPVTEPRLEPRAEFADGVHPDEFLALPAATAWNPHRLLGCHEGEWQGERGLVVRAWHPDARAIQLVVEGSGGDRLALRPLDPPGLFGLWMPGARHPFRYRLRFEAKTGPAWERADPYAFLPTVGDLDLYLHGSGNHYHAYRKLGAQLIDHAGTRGVAFAVWAPGARRVSVVGDFNTWDGRLHPMRALGSSGVWELFIPGLAAGDRYKFELLTQEGALREKTDPYAFSFDLRPATHARVVDRAHYTWGDDDYMHDLPGRAYLEGPLAVYEVHLGSWMRGAPAAPGEPDRWLNYRELAPRLADHAGRYGFTHVELLPVAEHPFDGSWGYQVTGYYAPTSRFGTPDDFKYFVDYLHQAGIGVLVDWVPAHFPKDDFALRRFDGTALYEHEDPRQGEHKDWGTLIFNYGRNEVRNFLLSNALFWLDEYHVDGLRVDAVASMIYLDYSRKDGEWIPNKYGGRENLEAIDFLRQLNEVVHGQYPGRFTVAEESTSFGGVSRPTYTGGLGFTFKWNMGWMNDTLRYFQKEPIFRQYHQNDLTFALIYQYTENFILPFSHDEVVHGKGSMLDKMPGDDWQKFANLRLLLAYMYAHPGKKLLFQGVEFGQWAEWDYARSVDWHQAGFEVHQGVERCLEDLGRLYGAKPAMWAWDNDPRGFRWIDFSDHGASVVSWVRQGPGDHLVCAFNMTPVPRPGYRIGMPKAGTYREVFNSDAAYYGGGNIGNAGLVTTDTHPHHGFEQSAAITIPPLGAVFFVRENK